MDSDTHVTLALNLMNVVGFEDRRAAAAALFPQIDRQPAYFHRLFAHCFDQVPNLVDAAETSGFWVDGPTAAAHHGAHSASSAGEYIENRLGAERDRLDSYLHRHAGLGISADSPPPEKAAVTLAIVSHIYNDTFNNPVQAFAPRTSIPSGAWSLWDELGTVEFRRVLYAPDRIEELRNELFAPEEWSFACSADALCAAMVMRVAGAAAHAVDPEIWIGTCARLGVSQALDSEGWRSAVEFLAHQDRRLYELFLKYGR